MDNLPSEFGPSRIGLVERYEAMSKKKQDVYFDVDDFEQISEHYIVTGQLDLAQNVLDSGIKQHAYNVGLYRLKAMTLIAQANFEKAIKVIKNAFALSPEDFELILLELECLGNIGKDQLALARLNTMLDYVSDEEKLDVLFVIAKIQENIGGFSECFDTYKAILDIDNFNKVALEKIWFCVELSGRYDESAALHTQLIDANAYNYMAWYNLGHAYTCLEKYDEALMAYEYTFLINEDFEYGYRDFVEILIVKSEFAKALETLKEIKARFEHDAELFLNMGQCYLQLEQYDQAFQHLIKAKEYDPLQSKIYFLLGLSEMACLNYESAIYYLSIAIELDGHKEEFHEAIASVHTLNGNFQGAIDALKNAINIAPDHWHFTVELAKLYIELFEYEKAYRTLTSISDVLNVPAIRYCIAVVTLIMGDEAEAFELLSLELQTNYAEHTILRELNVPSQYKEVIEDLIIQFQPRTTH